MNLRDLLPKKKRSIVFTGEGCFEDFINCGYKPLSKNPELVAGCLRIAELISSMTIYLMANDKDGDKRIINELSRKIDINPCVNMTRKTWMSAIVMNMLLYGEGNSIVYPHTSNGYLGSLEPISANRVSFIPGASSLDYKVLIDGKAYDPSDVLHFVYNPDSTYLWKGQGIKVAKDVVKNLSQAAETTRQFMNSKWKPSLIIKVDANSEEFQSKEKRKKILEDYVDNEEAGTPFVIPAELMDIEQVKPLSLNDLAINDSVTLDKKTVASILGVPSFVLGVGDYKESEWNAFVNNTIRPIAQGIEQEMTKKLITSEKWYLMFNMSKLYSYDLQKIADVYSGLFSKGLVTGNEAREKIGMEPREGLNDLVILENYIPLSDISKQLKLLQND